MNTSISFFGDGFFFARSLWISRMRIPDSFCSAESRFPPLISWIVFGLIVLMWKPLSGLCKTRACWVGAINYHLVLIKISKLKNRPESNVTFIKCQGPVPLVEPHLAGEFAVFLDNHGKLVVGQLKMAKTSQSPRRSPHFGIALAALN